MQALSPQVMALRKSLFSQVVLFVVVVVVVVFVFLSFVVVVVAISWAGPAAYGGSQARG